MKVLQTLTGDKLLIAGWSFLLISSSVFCIPLATIVSSEQYPAFFMFHFAIGIIYFFILIFGRRSKIEEHRIHYQFIKLILFLISAYALNRDMEVFAASPTWFSILLVILSLNYLAGIFFSFSPGWSRYLQFFLYGIGLTVFIYMSVYLMPLYLISIPGLIALGISIHTFVPLLLSIYTVCLANKLSQGQRKYWMSLGAGVVVTVLVLIGYAVVWCHKVNHINKEYTAAMVEGDDQLPLWIQVAQKMDADPISKKILKTGLVYKIPNWNDNLFWNIPGRNFGEEQQLHDPLVIISNLFSNKVFLSEDDRIKILESQYNARHQALERLWTGENLKTEQVVTNVRIWPKMHLAYTEKFITVYNHNENRAWPRQGEAIYTLHMPEGAVVTSLSLWIDGREEKAILTSKQKANTAYRTIVGYERRDPSVVHWQEGNTVTIRVFPVLSQSSRTFKIGVTAPLRRAGSQIVYDNMWFDGPDAGSAQETVKLEMMSAPQTFINYASFASRNEKNFVRTGTYKPKWNLAFRDLGFHSGSFSFNGYQYCISSYQPERVNVDITDVFLDVNQFWDASELDKIWGLIKNKKVWVYNRTLQLVNEANKEALFSDLGKQHFSLFPFHLIPDKVHSLVISKSGTYSPNISDLEGSAFLKTLRERTGEEPRIKLFHLGTELSPYLRSLKELGLFDFECGDLKLLQQLMDRNLFVFDPENDHEVIIHSAEAKIIKERGKARSTAPDHLMRLFAYNHIMQQLGKSRSAGFDSTAVMSEAEEAYVVSPVSSLVVLETKTDYDRFDIKESKSSLKNASLKSKGAVPEPGEWAIILIAATVLIVFFFKWKSL